MAKVHTEKSHNQGKANIETFQQLTEKQAK